MNDITCFNILIDALTKKNNILESLINISEKQKECISIDPFNYEMFDSYVNEKKELLDKLTQLDDGFEMVYAYLKNDINVKAPAYKQQVIKLQELIGCITEKSLKLEQIEKSNKIKIDAVFQSQRKGIKDLRRSSNTAMNYYRNMMGIDAYESFFLDKKN